MPTVIEWAEMTDPSVGFWTGRYKRIAKEVRRSLSSLGPDEELDPYSLVKRLMPDLNGTGIEGGKTFMQLLRILQNPTFYEASYVDGWSTQVWGRNRFNGKRNVRKQMWHAKEAMPPASKAEVTPPTEDNHGELEYKSWFPVRDDLSDLL